MMGSFNNATSGENDVQSTTSSSIGTRSNTLFHSSLVDSDNDISSVLQKNSEITSILSLPESSFENLNENHIVQTHRPELFNDFSEFTVKVFQLSLRRLEQAFPPLSSRSQSLVEVNKRASSSNHQVYSSLPPTANVHQSNNDMLLFLPSQASRLSPLENLCLNNCIKKIKPCGGGGLVPQEKKLLAHTLILADCFMFCYFFNYQTVLMSLEKSMHSGVNIGGLLAKKVQNEELVEDDVEKRFVSALREITDNTNGLGGFVNNVGSSPLTRSFSGLTSSSQKLSRSQSFGSKPFILIQLVIFPFSHSHVFSMGSDKRLRPYTLFRTGLMVGDWFLEWGEDSIVHPSLSNPYKTSPSCNCIQLCMLLIYIYYVNCVE